MALLIGIALGHTGLIERAPLGKTDSFGLRPYVSIGAHTFTNSY